MLLPKHHLQASNAVSNMLDESQFQPAGVDLTLKSVHKFLNKGKIDFDNKARRISDVEEIKPDGGDIHLSRGAYKVIFNEYVRIPPDAAAFCFPRSSLLRCGATLECAVWDPGYEGRSEALLIVENEHGITFSKNAKIGQLVFVKLAEAARQLYSGIYRGENK